VPKAAQRRKLRDLARKHKAEYLLVWLQIDNDSAFARTQQRDHRTADDRDAQEITQELFNEYFESMQNPQAEDFMVISGKHAFATQKSAIVNRLYQKGLVKSDIVQQTITKPELVNLIPKLSAEEQIEPLENYRNIAVF
jgi:gluconate kinase